MTLGRPYTFEVFYLENRGREPSASEWLAFTSVVQGKDGFDVLPIVPAEVRSYFSPVVIAAM